jgi:hypothetical protein
MLILSRGEQAQQNRGHGDADFGSESPALTILMHSRIQTGYRAGEVVSAEVGTTSEVTGWIG